MKEFLADFTEIYQRDFGESISDAKKKMGADEDNIRADIGGDEQRIIQEADYNKLKFKHLLLPAWVSAFRFQGKV